MPVSDYNKEMLLEMYRKMEEIRQFELKAVDLFKDGELPGFLHSCLGQEGSAAGVGLNLKDEDYVTTTHRGHGHVIAKGADFKKMMAELFAKVTGYCKGKGGSMHIMDAEKGILGANGIVGGGIPMATGAGITINQKNFKRVSVCFFGDGASNQGSFHESLNLAATWNLPVVYVIENNCYAESTHQACHQNIQDVAVRAKAYNMHFDIADGNDVIDVYEKAKKAVENAKNGNGPTLLEAKTYRWLGHYVGDPGVYRPDDEVKEWKAYDPIENFKKVVLENNLVSESDLNNISQEIEKEIDEAVEFGRESEEPELEEALRDVYHNAHV